MYTLDQLQQKIHRIYEGNTDYPADGEEDYELRTGLINDAINAWAYEHDTQWRELFANLASAATGTKTTTASDSTYDAPDDFINISSFVKITDANGGNVYYPFKKNDEVLNLLKNNSNEKFFYITGNPDDGYVININPSPTSTGETITYSYYKRPTELSNTSDVPEMSKPYYIVYHVLARLYELDNRNDLVTFYEQKAEKVMNSMIIDNEVPPFNNSNELGDLEYDLDGVRFGK